MYPMKALSRSGSVFAISFLAAPIMFVGVGMYFFSSPSVAPEHAVAPVPDAYHQFSYFEYISQVEESVKSADAGKNIGLDVVLGGVAPHHIPTTIPLLAEFYAQLKGARDVKTFVILGPDHIEKGKGGISVSEADFVTPFARLQPDLQMIKALRDAGFVTHDEAPFSGEHSMGAQVLLISKFFPNARIVPVVFRSSVSNVTARAFGDALADIAGEDAFVVASVDFSHYLSEAQARPVDLLSSDVLSGTTSQFGGLVEADSTQALSTLKAYLAARGANTNGSLRSFNTGDFGSNEQFTTGYTVGFWGVKSNQSGSDITNKDVELLFVGDIMLSRMIGDAMARKNDWKYHFAETADLLREADLTIGNLEGPISSRGVDSGSMYSFRADPRSIEGILYAGLDVFSIANNHILDWGRDALTDTITILNKESVVTVGAGRDYAEANAPYIKEVRGMKIAFFGYTDLYPRSLWATEDRGGVSTPMLENIKRSIAAVRSDVDLVILLWHWGDEYKTKAREKERVLAYTLIDAGADVIIGHHPHAVQEVEEYNGGLIAYSLGNFIFDQNFSEATKQGLALKVVARNGRIFSTEQIGIGFTSDFRPFVRTQR